MQTPRNLPRDPSPPKRSGRLGKGGLLLLGLFVGLLGAEFATRVLGAAAEDKKRDDWARAMSEELEHVPKGKVNLGHIIRPAHNEGVIYRMRANLDVEFMGGHVTTNSRGFRTPEFETKKPDGVYRILALGDSIMFGFGCNDGECCLRVMEKLLNERRQQERSPRYEVINTATVGYNTAMEVALFEHVALEYEPDLVLIDWVGNDLTLSDFIETRTDFWRLDHSFLLEWLLELLSGGAPGDDFIPLTNSPRNGILDDPQGVFEYRKERVPVRFHYMLGPEGYWRAMRRLKALSEKHGFRVAITSSLAATPLPKQVSKELGFPLFEGIDLCNAYLARHGIPQYLGSPLSISATDGHPSAVFHRMLGEFYAEQLRKNGLLEPD